MLFGRIALKLVLDLVLDLVLALVSAELGLWDLGLGLGRRLGTL